jgi:poly(A) polymerase
LSRGATPKGLDLSPYAGRWVALIGGRVVGQGGTPEQARQSAQNIRYKETPQIMYAPPANPLNFSPILERVRQALPTGIGPVYLVGGAVRDTILSQEAHDFDFVIAGDALKIARTVADGMGADFYPLDEDRKTGRVIFVEEAGTRHILDFAALRGADIEADLRDRDFTINAIAVNLLEPQEILDPTGGASDLWQKTLRACSPASFVNDPVRVLRAIRLAAGYGLRIYPETRSAMGEAVPLLGVVTPERLRDEFFRILGGSQPHTSIRALEMLGALPYITPELLGLKEVPQSPPHVRDVWGHTLDTLKNLDALLTVLKPQRDPEDSNNLMMGLVALHLGRYREQINTHIETDIVQGRSNRPLIFLAALYHDIAKPQARQNEDNGRIRFLNHDQIGADIVAQRAVALKLSNVEISRLQTIVKNHMRPGHLAHGERQPSGRAIYRFFRDTGIAGIDICLLSLADLLATYGSTLPQDRWTRQLEIVRVLLEAWWERPEKQVNPPRLVTGYDLMDEFGLEPGPRIGLLLDPGRKRWALSGKPWNLMLEAGISPG